ncbi:MAG: nitrilase-related carbon-nitrogen hydrolase [Candidatus Bilamarchaeum sp.]|jgi:predicted amidohydrolase
MIEMKVKIGLVQMNMVENKEVNLKKAIKLIRKAAKEGAQIVALPELFNTLYFCNIANGDFKNWAEPIPGATTQKLSELAKELHIVLLAGSIYEFDKKDGKYYNTAVAFDQEGRQIGEYRKMHIPHDPSFYEQHYFEKGNFGYKIFETKYGKISTLICYDQWFPEAARILALEGVKMIFYPTAIGRVRGVEQVEGDWQNAWQAVQVGHSAANGIIVAAINRVGTEGQSVFWGGSFVAQFGTVLVGGKSKPNEKERVIVCEVDTSLVDITQKGWRWLNERRPETYSQLTKS